MARGDGVRMGISGRDGGSGGGIGALEGFLLQG